MDSKIKLKDIITKEALCNNAQLLKKRKCLRDFHITEKGETMKYTQVITEEIRKLVRHFKSKEKYKAFKQAR